MRIEAEMAQQNELTFKPKVNKKSQKLAILRENENSFRRCNSASTFNRAPSAAVTDRLYRDANERLEKGFFNATEKESVQTKSVNLNEFYERQAKF